MKKLLSKLGIGTGLTLGVTLLVVATVAVLVGILGPGGRQLAFEEAQQTALNMAYRYGNLIDAELEVALDAARFASQTIVAQVEHDKATGETPDRESVSEQLKNILDHNPTFLGVWTCWEPNAFDGKDADFVDQPGHDATGRFIPYWNRGAGSLKLECLVDYAKEGAGDYYLVPMKSGKETIVNPYEYEVAGKKMLMTSLVVPIIDVVSKKAIGVVGVDFTLDQLSSIISEIKPYGTGYGAFLSYDGKLAAHPDPQLVGKDISKGKDAMMAAIQAGKEYSAREESMSGKGVSYKVHVPVVIGETSTPWSFSIVVPESAVTAKSDALMRQALWVGLVACIVAVLVGILIARIVMTQVERRNQWYEAILDNMPNPLSITDMDMKWTFVNKPVEQLLNKTRAELAGQHCSNWGAAICKTDNCGIECRRRNQITTHFSQWGLDFQVDTHYLRDHKGNPIGHMEIVTDITSKKRLETVIGRVTQTVQQLKAGTDQISSASQALSQGATEQAVSIEEITSSMTEVASQTKTNAENASQADRLAQEAKSSAAKGSSQMEEMLSSINGISKSSREVAKIIKVIDDIAFQTNLLALNAAVEAARAGRHGKGFAVVADEVRNLAARSAKAAKETGEMIASSVQQVETGANIAAKTADALKEIVTAATRVTDLVSEIAGASTEQAQGISQINTGLSQIDKVTQQNTASAEETASAAQELGGIAARLKRLVDQFQAGASMTDDEPEPAVETHPPRRAQVAHSEWGSGPNRAALPKPDRMAKPSDVIALDDSEFGKY